MLNAARLSVLKVCHQKSKSYTKIGHNCPFSAIGANFQSFCNVFKRQINMSFTLYGHATIQPECVGMCVCVCVRVKDSECVSVGHQSGIPGLGKLNADPKPNNSWPHLLAFLLLLRSPPLHLIFATGSFQKQRMGGTEERVWGMEVCPSFLSL